MVNNKKIMKHNNVVKTAKKEYGIIQACYLVILTKTSGIIYKIMYGNHPLNFNFIKSHLKSGQGKMALTRWRAVNYIFTCLRYARDCVKNKPFDINADYKCCECSKPILRNCLFCSDQCCEKSQGTLGQ